MDENKIIDFVSISHAHKVKHDDKMSSSHARSSDHDVTPKKARITASNETSDAVAILSPKCIDSTIEHSFERPVDIIEFLRPPKLEGSKEEEIPERQSCSNEITSTIIKDGSNPESQGNAHDASNFLQLLCTVANEEVHDENTLTNCEHSSGIGSRENFHQKRDHAICSLTYDFSDWLVGPRYKMIRFLGRGSYGEVAEAQDLYDKNEVSHVAIKRITATFEQEVEAIRLFREIHILRHLRGHSCIIQLLDIIPHDISDLSKFHELYLVFEYVDTDLYKLIMSPQYLTSEHVQTFLYQLLLALKFIHSSSVIHRDLKPANILLNEDCSLKICDFGLARIVDLDASTHPRDDTIDTSNGTWNNLSHIPYLPKQSNLSRQLTKHVVTRWYRAPELILIQPYSSAVDIWSAGCIFAELLSMQEGNTPSYEDRVPLFPGGSCYPLSCEGLPISTEEQLDQLSIIFDVIGWPSDEDMESVAAASQYIKSIRKGKGILRSFESIYPAAEVSAINLLKNMLQFNPTKRCTADEALEHEYFRHIRRKELEISADRPLLCPTFLSSLSLSVDEIKKWTVKEILLHKNNVRS